MLCNNYMMHAGRLCDREAGHPGVCGYTNMCENCPDWEVFNCSTSCCIKEPEFTYMTDTRKPELNKDTPVLTTAEYRSQVSNCRACRSRGRHEYPDRLFETPRFGLGNRNQPKLMVIGRGPSRIAERCLHGAGYRLMYPLPSIDNPPTADEINVVKLLSNNLGLNLTKDIYATGAVKCPTHFDREPTRFLSMQCGHSHLRREIVDVRPRIILALGYTAYDTVGTTCMLQKFVNDKGYTVEYLSKTSTRGVIRCRANIVEAPTPDEIEWSSEVIEKIAQAVRDRYLFCYGEEW